MLKGCRSIYVKMNKPVSKTKESFGKVMMHMITGL